MSAATTKPLPAEDEPLPPPYTGGKIIPRRGWLFNFLFPFTSWFVANFSAGIAKMFMVVLNRTIVFGVENVPDEHNTVMLPNHQSMLDGFLIGAFVFFPRSILRPGNIPWLPAASENFFGNPVIAWLSDNWKCIPVRPGRKDFRAMKRMLMALKDGRMIVFPEGTRSRDGGLLPPRSGIGFVMLKNRSKAVPVCMDGMDRILPIGSFWPRVFETVYLYIGEPVDLSEFYDKPLNRETAQAAIEKVFSEVRRMKNILGRYRKHRQRALARRPFFLRLFRA